MVDIWVKEFVNSCASFNSFSIFCFASSTSRDIKFGNCWVFLENVISIKNLYPFSVGTLPAEVWGWLTYPCSVNSCNSFLMVAGEISKLHFLFKRSELIGSAKSIYSLMREFKIFLCLAESLSEGGSWRSVRFIPPFYKISNRLSRVIKKHYVLILKAFKIRT